VNVKELQDNLPWTVPYSGEFDRCDLGHKYFSHALMHVLKSAGKIAAVIEAADHTDNQVDFTKIEGQIADLVISALRMANVSPSGKFDLEQVVLKRLEEKNGVKL
jgi:hypothetical protein